MFKNILSWEQSTSHFIPFFFIYPLLSYPPLSLLLPQFGGEMIENANSRFPANSWRLTDASNIPAADINSIKGDLTTVNQNTKYLYLLGLMFDRNGFPLNSWRLTDASNIPAAERSQLISNPLKGTFPLFTARHHVSSSHFEKWSYSLQCSSAWIIRKNSFDTHDLRNTTETEVEF